MEKSKAYFLKGGVLLSAPKLPCIKGGEENISLLLAVPHTMQAYSLLSHSDFSVECSD